MKTSERNEKLAWLYFSVFDEYDSTHCAYWYRRIEKLESMEWCDMRQGWFGRD